MITPMMIKLMNVYHLHYYKKYIHLIMIMIKRKIITLTMVILMRVIRFILTTLIKLRLYDQSKYVTDH